MILLLKIIGASLILLTGILIYVFICVYRISGDNYRIYKQGLGSFHDVMWGDGTDETAEGVQMSDAVDEYGNLKIKRSYSLDRTRSLYR